MATKEELKSVLKETLENRGVLGQVKARIRAEVFNALDDQAEAQPTLSNENMLINELIREYLEFNKYKYTLSVLLTGTKLLEVYGEIVLNNSHFLEQQKTGQPKEPIDRKFINHELKISEDHASGSMPLLYGLLNHFLQGHHRQERRKGDSNSRRSQGIRNKSSEAVYSSDFDQSFGHEPAAFEVRGAHR